MVARINFRVESTSRHNGFSFPDVPHRHLGRDNMSDRVDSDFSYRHENERTYRNENPVGPLHKRLGDLLSAGLTR